MNIIDFRPERALSGNGKNIISAAVRCLAVLFFFQTYAASAQAEAARRPECSITVVAPGVSPSSTGKVRAEAARLMDKAAAFVGHRPSGPFVIYIAANAEQFRAYAGAGVPDWAVAIYEPQKRAVVVKPAAFTSSPRNFTNTLQHELVHAVLEHKFRAHPSALPRWLNEGLAVSLSDAWEAPESWENRKTALYSALKQGGTLDFESLEHDFPAGNLIAQMAYMQSYDMTEYIIRRWGMDRMRRLLDELAGGRPAAAAWRAVYKMPLEDIIADWKTDIGRPGPLIWFYHFLAQFDMYIWAAISALAVVAAFKARARLRRRRLPSEIRNIYDPEDDWDDLDEEWDPDLYGYRPWRPNRPH